MGVLITYQCLCYRQIYEMTRGTLLPIAIPANMKEFHDIIYYEVGSVL